ncbi:MAG: zf-HC2 domain-containing protein [Bacteroidota bacterium]
MNCKEIRDLIIVAPSEGLDEESKRMVQGHVATCEECSRELAAFEALFKDLHQFTFELPDKDLKMGFEQMLEREQAALDKFQSSIAKSKPSALLVVWRIAAVFALMIASYCLGSFNSHRAAQADIVHLAKENAQLQKVSTLSLLNNESATKRLQAVSDVEKMDQPDTDVLHLLIAKMNHDQHVNVRLASANALVRFADQMIVRRAFLETLGKEQNTHMQIELIQILVTIEEKASIPIIKKVLTDEEMPDYIKEQIHLELEQII